MKLLYLAAPYTDPSRLQRENRANLAAIASAALIESRDDLAVYSPITHGHQLEKYMETRQSHGFWMKQCFAIFDQSDVLGILPLIGWRKSSGVRQEISRAKHLGIPIKLILDCLPPGVFQGALDIPSNEELSSLRWQVL